MTYEPQEWDKEYGSPERLRLSVEISGKADQWLEGVDTRVLRHLALTSLNYLEASPTIGITFHPDDLRGISYDEYIERYAPAAGDPVDDTADVLDVTMYYLGMHKIHEILAARGKEAVSRDN